MRDQVVVEEEEMFGVSFVSALRWRKGIRVFGAPLGTIGDFQSDGATTVDCQC